jgi:hypothetical protein
MQARTDAISKLAGLGEQSANRGASLLGQSGGLLSGQSSGINSMYGLQQAGQSGWNQLGQDMFKTFGDYLMKQRSSAKAPGPWASGYQF